MGKRNLSKIQSGTKHDAYGSLADRIRMARKRAHISQTELAGEVSVTASAVAQWEHPRGTRPSLENIVLVAQVTEVSLEWLATGNGGLSRAKAGSSGEVPAVALDVYARSVQEEVLLDRFRQIPALRRNLLISIVEAFIPAPRSRTSKRG